MSRRRPRTIIVKHQHSGLAGCLMSLAIIILLPAALVTLLFFAGCLAMIGIGVSSRDIQYERSDEPIVETYDVANLHVVRIIDGDTIVVRYQGKDESVRLLNIDAPERGDDGFDASTEALHKLIGDRVVDLEWEKPGVPSRDRYGRLLAFVFITVPAGPPGGRIHINVEMVRGGWAEYYTKYGKGRYAGDFKVRANKVGEPRKLCLALAYNVWLVVESGMNVRKMQKKSLTSLYSGPILR